MANFCRSNQKGYLKHTFYLTDWPQILTSHRLNMKLTFECFTFPKLTFKPHYLKNKVEKQNILHKKTQYLQI